MAVFLSDYDYVRLKGLLEKLREGSRIDRVPLNRLEEKLEVATTSFPEYVPETTVTINSKVRFTNLDTGDEQRYTIVFPGESDIDKNKVSILSPIGISLLGASVGSVVECHAPAGVIRIRVDEILYQPEAAGYFFV